MRFIVHKDTTKCKIKITKDGPYIVSGNIPLSEKIIVPKAEDMNSNRGVISRSLRAMPFAAVENRKLRRFAMDHI